MNKFAAVARPVLVCLLFVSAAEAQTAATSVLDFLTAPPAYSWNGAYAGLQIGRTMLQSPGGQQSAFQTASGAHVTVSPTVEAGTGDENANASGGATVGYNRQFGRAVLGIEGTGSSAASQTNQNCDAVDSAFFGAGTTADCRTDLRYSASLDGRVGYAIGRLLPYVKAGGSWAAFHHDVLGTLASGAAAPTSSFNESRWGYNFGAGLEYALAAAWSVKFEYEYMDFGTRNLTEPFTNTSPFAPGTFTGYATDTEKVSTLRVGLNYRF